VDRDGRLVRRPVSSAGRDRRADAVLGALAQGRLVVLGDGTAEIAHDALLQAWSRLRGWLEEDQSSLILYGQLTKDTARWRQDGKDSSRLYRGVQLAAAREAARVWAADPGRYPALPAAEAEFLRASGRAGTRRRRGRRTLAGALVLLLLAALAGAGLAVRSARDDASRQRTAATSARLAGQSTTLQATDPVTASLLAGAAWRIAPTAQARYSLLESLAQPVRGILSARSGEVTAVASSPGGKTLAAAYRDGTIRLWDTASHRLVSTATWGGAADALAFAGNGKTLEVAGPTAVGTWNLAGRATIARQPLAGVTGITGGRSAAFSPDGSKLATGSGEGNVRLWDVATRQEIGAPMSSGLAPVEAVAFGGEDGDVRLWDTATQSQPDATMATGAPVAALTVSGNGTTLATAEGNGSTELWSTATQEQTGSALAAQGSARVSALDFGPGAGLLATGDATGTITLWNAAGFHQSSAPVVTGTPASPAAAGRHAPAALSAHGEILAVSGQRGTIRLRNTRTGRPVGQPIMTHQAVTGLALSPGGKTFVTVGANGTAALWSVATGHRVGALMSTGAAVSPGRPAVAAAFSPDGRILATAVDGSIRLWDTTTRQQIGTPMTAGPSPAYAVAFSRDGRTLVTAGGDGTARSWDVAFPAGLLAGACAIADQSLTRQQWASYAGTQPFQRVCPAS
jgi:WD40 repeat protein